MFFKPDYSETTTLKPIKSDKFCFGVPCQSKNVTTNDYIKTLARQIATYNQKESVVWPDNSVKDYYAVVQSVESDKAWIIAPNGQIEHITTNDVKEMVPNPNRFSVGFSKFNYQGKNGFYLALSENDFPNVLEYEKYYHLGTYDIFITYVHELFHMVEQSKWASSDKVINGNRDDRFDDLQARTQRNLIFEQILAAVAETDSIKKELNIKTAVSGFKKYKEVYTDDYLNSIFMDRVEGSAHYFEMISSLYSAYPDQVKKQEDLYEALALIATHIKSTDAVGLSTEGYWLAGWTGVLLDQIEKEQKNNWKNELKAHPELTTLEILNKKYENEDLPEATQFTPEHENRIEEKIVALKSTSPLPALFKLFYQLIF